MSAHLERRARAAWLVALAAILSLAAFVLMSGGEPEAPTPIRFAAPAFAAAPLAASQLRVQGEGFDLRLQRIDGRWRGLSTPFPVREAAVQDLVQALASLRLTAPLTDDPAQFAALGVADPESSGPGAGVRIQAIEPQSGAFLANLILGQRQGRIYVRPLDGGPDRVWRAQGDFPALRPVDVLAPPLPRVDRNRLIRLDIFPSTAPSYGLSGQPLTNITTSIDTAKAEQLAAALLAPKANAFVRAPLEGAAPAGTARLILNDGGEIHYSFVRRETKLYATISMQGAPEAGAVNAALAGWLFALDPPAGAPSLETLAPPPN